MPMIDADGCLLNVSVEGRDSGPTLMLSNSLGSTMQMWEPQMAALKQIFRVIRYDRRYLCLRKASVAVHCRD